MSSSTYQQRPTQRSSSSSGHTSGGEGMHRVPTYSPTPSTSQQVFYPNQSYYAQPSSSYSQSGGDASRSDMMSHQLGHPNPHGRMALPHHGGIISVNPGTMKSSKTPTPSPSADPNCGPSPFLPEEPSPFIRPANLPPHFEGQSLHHQSNNNSNGEDSLYIRTPLSHHMQPPPNHHGMMTSPEMGPPGYILSPTDQMRMQQQNMASHMGDNNPNGHHLTRSGHLAFQSDQLSQRPASQGHLPSRPMMQQRHTMQVQQRPPHLQRQMSLQHPNGRSSSPHMAAGDVFDPIPVASPLMRPNSSLGFVENHAGPSGYIQEDMSLNYDYNPQMDPNVSFFPDPMQGISPARALGPAPSQTMRFSPIRHNDPMVTPQTQKNGGYSSTIHSSATSSTATTQSSTSSATSGSNFSATSASKRDSLTESDDDNDSPTKGLAPVRIKRIPMDNVKSLKIKTVDQRPTPKGSAPVVRPSRPLPRPATNSMGAGRTSAKFAKVADDPGVEGIPPGPRPLDRPGPSFACIIGQAILKCKAGGLSLEHIYRYVETAYPYFKTGDGAWRNSVRHNLSIHKMFETIPRTEKFPAGKGGIWIIHEDEKCHWPEDNKFIKNFPASHPHHANCRQTLHERQKEQEAMDRAAREGRAYVPKKGKKGRKLSSKDEEDDEGGFGMEMTRSSSSLGDGRSSLQAGSQLPSIHLIGASSLGSGQQAPRSAMLTSEPHPSALITHSPNIPLSLPPTMTSTPILQHRTLSSSDFEDDGDFLPLDMEYIDMDLKTTPKQEGVAESDLVAQPTTAPRSEKTKSKRRPMADEDIENVFTAPKRVRVAEPLAPINPHPQERLLPGLDDSYVTPERAGNNQYQRSSMSSAFKTPALVNTSSSPGSSPMPTSILRGPHHPSSLQQAWTHDDIDLDQLEIDAPSSTPASGRGLESAFDLKPLSSIHNGPTRSTRHHLQEDDLTTYPLTSHAPSGPPKTPVTRSSAAATEKTPRHFRTPGPMSLGPTSGVGAGAGGGGGGASAGISSLNGLKTPAGGYAGSPGMVPPSASHLLSTPLWEIHHCLNRLGKGGIGSELASPTRSPSRNSVPSTSPTRYAMLLPPVDGNGSPASKRREVV